MKPRWQHLAWMRSVNRLVLSGGQETIRHFSFKEFLQLFHPLEGPIVIHQKKVRHRLTHHSSTSSSCW